MAIEPSTKQMALTRDWIPGGFMERVQVWMADGAGVVLNEADTVPHHGERVAYAQRVVFQSMQAAIAGGPQIVMDPAIVTTTTYNETDKTSVCTISDTALKTVIKNSWNALAAIIMNPVPPATVLAAAVPPLLAVPLPSPAIPTTPSGE